MRKNMNMDVVAAPGDALPHGPLANAPLENSPRDEFDYRFMSRMVSDHQAAIDAGAAAQRLARDPELKGLIGRQLAMMSDHQAAAHAAAGARSPRRRRAWCSCPRIRRASAARRPAPTSRRAGRCSSNRRGERWRNPRAQLGAAADEAERPFRRLFEQR